MQLIIDIPEEEYRWIKKSDKTVFADVASKECMLHAIKNGTPLSKYTSLKKSYKKTYVSDGKAIKGANDTLRNLGMDYWE